MSKVKPEIKPHLFFLLFLGACQGLMGWYMVKSGLVDRPDVSQYRLTAHLGLAIAIYGYIVWLTIGLFSPDRETTKDASLGVFSVVALVYVMILSGGFVAGTNAGLSFPTWPHHKHRSAHSRHDSKPHLHPRAPPAGQKT